VDPVSDDAVKDVVATKRQQSEAEATQVDLAKAARMTGLAVRALYLLVGGVVMIVLGIWMIFSPDTRNDPRGFTLRDLWPGLGPIIVGLVLIGFIAYVPGRRKKSKPASKGGDAGSSTGPPQPVAGEAAASEPAKDEAFRPARENPP
jgi:hypothetical protein